MSGNTNALKNRATLVAARESEVLVRVTRSVEAGHVDGYVCGIGRDFFLLQVVSDLILLNGYEALRIKDVSCVDVPAPHSIFVESALDLRDSIRALPPDVDLTDVASVLSSAAVLFPLVTIHHEQRDPHTCHIGIPESISAGFLSMRAITPDAEWETELIEHELSSITQISFGGMYESALWLVGGSERERVAASPMTRAWREAVVDLELQLESPFALEDETDVYWCAGLLRDFGSPSGALIIGKESADEVFDVAEAQGYYCSGLNPEYYETYSRERFVETLSDWGWFGDPANAPAWFKGTRGRHGGAD